MVCDCAYVEIADVEPKQGNRKEVSNQLCSDFGRYIYQMILTRWDCLPKLKEWGSTLKEQKTATQTMGSWQMSIAKVADRCQRLSCGADYKLSFRGCKETRKD